MSRQHARYVLLPLVAGLLLSACDPMQKKKEEELAKTTFACQLNGERFVVRFVEGEARVRLEITVVNQEGASTCPGHAIVALPTRGS